MEEGPLASDLLVAAAQARREADLSEQQPLPPLELIPLRFNAEVIESPPAAPAPVKRGMARRPITFAAISSVALFFSLVILVITDVAIQHRREAFKNMPIVDIVSQLETSTTNPKRRVALINLALERGIILEPEQLGVASDRLIAISIAKYAAKMHREAFIPRLITQLQDSDSGVRRASAKALGILGGKDAEYALTKAAPLEADPQVRETIDAALATF